MAASVAFLGNKGVFMKTTTTTTMYKPNGTKLEVNDSSLEHAIDLGWTDKPPKKKEPKKVKKAK